MGKNIPDPQHCGKICGFGPILIKKGLTGAELLIILFLGKSKNIYSTQIDKEFLF
jgi:hypothetical protein